MRAFSWTAAVTADSDPRVTAAVEQQMQRALGDLTASLAQGPSASADATVAEGPSASDAAAAAPSESGSAEIAFEQELLQTKSPLLAGLVSLYGAAEPSVRLQVQARARMLLDKIDAWHGRATAKAVADLDSAITQLQHFHPVLSTVLSQLAANQRQLEDRVDELKKSQSAGGAPSSSIVADLLIVPTCSGCNGHSYAQNVPCLASDDYCSAFQRLTSTGDMALGNAFCCKPQHFRTATAGECLLWATAESLRTSETCQ